MKRSLILAFAAACAIAWASAAFAPIGVEPKDRSPAQETESALERPRCAYCKKPLLHSFVVVDTKKYHKECYEEHVALRCAVCGKIVEGKYLYDFWGNVYHESHEGKMPRCEYCLRFISEAITGGGVEYADGRHVCNICRRGAVDDPEAAGRLLEEVRGRLERLGLGTGDEKIPVRLVNLAEMQRITGSHSHTLRGYTEHQETRVSPGEIKTRRSEIYLLRGMPRLESIATLAHELTHIWRFLQGRQGADEAFDEGSCNYASYLIVMQFPGKEGEFVAKSLTESPDPVYGEGFRRVKHLVERRGLPAWIERLKASETFPSGY